MSSFRYTCILISTNRKEDKVVQVFSRSAGKSIGTAVLDCTLTKKDFIFMNFEPVVFASLIWKCAVSFATTVWRSVQTSCAYLCTHHISTSSVLPELSLHVQMCPFHSAKSLTGLFRLWPWGSSLELEAKQAEQDSEDGDVFNPFVWPTTGKSGGDFSRCLFTTDFLKELHCG